MLNGKVLLVGNGINYGSDNYLAWDELLECLRKKVELPEDMKIEHFPLFYEKIYFYGLINGKIKEENDLRTIVNRKLGKFKTTALHKSIINCGFEHILTTNYDYALENSGRGIKSTRVERILQEKRYSLFRKRKVGKVNLWHIHGEIGNPLSIMLGHEQYGGYLQHIRNYIVSGRTYREDNKKKKISALLNRLRDTGCDLRETESWVNLFFTKNIYILGFGLDFLEFHLWWLLSFRARQKFEKKLPLNNKITYIYSDFEEKKPHSNGCVKADNKKKKIDTLKRFDVSLMPISAQYNDGFYEKALSQISGS